ncbi:hypothetical protein C8R45DRAFT_937953 [Mycena sanguinolenta]|nr:hypothetical protein C8R45DRAFT_937953 [Mycena sanguinolenta]
MNFAGERGCIGFNFALQEIKNVLARVVLNFKIENTTEVDPEVLTEGTPRKVEEKIQATQPAVGSKALPRLWAVHASNNGICEGIAGGVVAKARRLGFAGVQAMYNGEPPDSALSFLDTEVKAGNSPKNEKRTGDSNGDQDEDFTQWATRLWTVTAASFGVDVEGATLILSRLNSLIYAIAARMRLLTFDVLEGFTYEKGGHMEVSCYVDFFLPEFDVHTDIHVRESGEVPYFPPAHPGFISTSTSNFILTQVRIKAEYLQFIAPRLLCWNLFLRGFFQIEMAPGAYTATRSPLLLLFVGRLVTGLLGALVHDNLISKANAERGFVVIEPCGPTDDTLDICGEDSIAIFAEPVPQDKSSGFHSDPVIHSKKSSDSELTYAGLQDINDPFPMPPHVQFIELDYPTEKPRS